MFTRDNLDKYIVETYGTVGELPWVQYPTNTVYRHRRNKKWFAVVMTLPKSKLGIDSDEKVDVINLKCDNLMMGSLLSDEGIFPAYHMNKNHWISVLLGDSVDDEKIKWLLDMSFELTDINIRKKDAKGIDSHVT